jgi:hypothetical protein
MYSVLYVGQGSQPVIWLTIYGADWKVAHPRQECPTLADVYNRVREVGPPPRGLRDADPDGDFDSRRHRWPVRSYEGRDLIVVVAGRRELTVRERRRLKKNRWSRH